MNSTIGVGLQQEGKRETAVGVSGQGAGQNVYKL